MTIRASMAGGTPAFPGYDRQLEERAAIRAAREREPVDRRVPLRAFGEHEGRTYRIFAAWERGRPARRGPHDDPRKYGGRDARVPRLRTAARLRLGHRFLEVGSRGGVRLRDGVDRGAEGGHRFVAETLCSEGSGQRVE